MTDDRPAGGPTAKELRNRLRRYTVSTGDLGAEPNSIDLQSLGKRFDDAAVIGLGESNHATREFFQLKQRLIRSLLTEFDCRLIAFEASLAGMAASNRYIVHGEGTVDEALDGLSDFYRTKSFRSLLERLEAFNNNRPPADRVRVYGIDLDPSAAVTELREFFSVADPTYAKSLGDSFEAAQRVRWTDNQETIAETRNLVDKLRDRFRERTEEYAKRTSAERLEFAKRYVREIESAAAMRGSELHGDEAEAFAIREKTMADTLLWLLDWADRDQIAVWADNVHLTYGTEKGDPLLGDHLRKRFGDGYYALAIDFGTHAPPSAARGRLRDRLEEHVDATTPESGALEAVTAASNILADTAEVSLHDALASFGEDAVVLDFDRAVTDPAVRHWLDQLHCFHSGIPVPDADLTKLVRIQNPFTTMDGFAYVREGNWPTPLAATTGAE